MLNILSTFVETDVTFDDTTFRAQFLKNMVAKTQPLYRRYFCQNRPQWLISTAELQGFPVNSLGRRLFTFLNTHNYTLMRKLESHDVFHVLLDYSPTTLDEACMQFCLIGSGKKSSYARLACLGALLVYPEYAMVYYRHYQRGKTLKNFSSWDFEALLSCNLHQLHKEIRNYSAPLS